MRAFARSLISIYNLITLMQLQTHEMRRQYYADGLRASNEIMNNPYNATRYNGFGFYIPPRNI